MTDIIIIAIIILTVGAAAAYIIKAKKSGKRCIGCPDSASCHSGGQTCSGCCGCSCGADSGSSENTETRKE